MKLKSLAAVFLLIASNALYAQSYKMLRVAIGGGVALPQGANGMPGPVISLEPGFRLTDNLMIGLKAEGAMLTRGMSRDLDTASPASQIISGTVFTQLYLSRNYIRPFFSGGVGYSMVSDQELSVTFGGSSETLTIGQDQVHFMLRAGIEIWHFSLNTDLMFSSDEKPADFLEIKNAYLSFRLMFFIGGGLQ